LRKTAHELVEQILDRFARFSAAKSGNGRVIRHWFSLQQPDEVDIFRQACSSLRVEYISQ
jgi:hypothetical protein